MIVSPYLTRRLRSLDEFLKAKGEEKRRPMSSGVRTHAGGCTSVGSEQPAARRERAHLTRVPDTTGAMPPR